MLLFISGVSFKLCFAFVIFLTSVFLIHGRHARIFGQIFEDIFEHMFDQIFLARFWGQNRHFYSFKGTGKYSFIVLLGRETEKNVLRHIRVPFDLRLSLFLFFPLFS